MKKVDTPSKQECGLCGTDITDTYSYPALFVGRICTECESVFKRTKIPPYRETHKMRNYLRGIERRLHSVPFKMKIRLKNGVTFNHPIEPGRTVHYK